VAVPSTAIEESIDVVSDVRQRDFAGRIDALLDALLFQTAEYDSTTALSPQLPFRRMLGSRCLAQQKRR
jgi:hypothetical protein